MKNRAKDACWLCGALIIMYCTIAAARNIELDLQRRIAIGPRDLKNSFASHLTGTWAPVREKLIIDGTKLAVVVVDMWDSHSCGAMHEQETSLIPQMNLFLRAARTLGIQIIFAPSRCGIAEKWRDRPQRVRVREISVFPLPPSNSFNPFSTCATS